MSIINAGRETVGRSSATARVAGAVALVLMAWFVLAPGSVVLVWGLGYAAIVVGFLYRQWAASRYATHEPTTGEIAFVLAIAALWTSVLFVLYLAVVSLRFVGASILDVLRMPFSQ